METTMKESGEILDEYGVDYTYQPNGTQNFPDYEIPHMGAINLECEVVMLNLCTTVVDHTQEVCMYSRKKYNETTLFWGDDVLTGQENL